MLGKGYPEITILSRNQDYFRKKYPDLADTVKWVHGDILDPSSLPYSHHFSHILHAAAASTSGPEFKPLDRYSQIVDGTRHILDLAVATGASRFLLTSSGGVYGPQPSEVEKIPENYNGIPDPLNAQNAYSVAKRAAEHLCALYQEHYGIQSIIARCFTFVGQDLPVNIHFAVGNFIRDALLSPQINVKGDGTPVRSYMDQRDLAHWLLMLMRYGRAGQAYNVGSDAAISIADLAFLVRDTLAPSKMVIINQGGGSENFRNRYVPSIQKAREELSLDLQYNLVDSLKVFSVNNMVFYNK